LDAGVIRAVTPVHLSILVQRTSPPMLTVVPGSPHSGRRVCPLMHRRLVFPFFLWSLQVIGFNRKRPRERPWRSAKLSRISVQT